MKRPVCRGLQTGRVTRVQRSGRGLLRTRAKELNNQYQSTTGQIFTRP
jgi:hypothetical protein